MHLNAKMVEIKNLYFSYGGHKIIEDLNLEISKGDFVALLGHNGAGKTTLIKLILGMLKPKKGSINISTKKIGYVQQGFEGIENHFHASVYEVVAMGLLAQKDFAHKEKKEEKMVERALEKVGLKEKKNKLIGDLSGGQKQKAYLARALAKSPELLILDEPTNNLDVKSQKEFYRVLKDLNKKGLTILLVTHDIGLILSIAKEIAVLNKKITFRERTEKLDMKKLMKIIGGI